MIIKFRYKFLFLNHVLIHFLIHFKFIKGLHLTFLYENLILQILLRIQ